jgi:superfamily II DNA helicase RecQ
VLAYADGDESVQRRLWGPNPPEGTLAGFQALRSYALGTGCRRRSIAVHFGASDIAACGECDACTTPDLVQASLARLTREKRARTHAAREKQREEASYELSEHDLDRVVAFVDALKKPLGRRLVMRALRGSRARDVRKYKLTENPHFGALESAPESAIFRAIDTLLSRALLVPKGKKYPTLWVAGKPVRSARGAGMKRPEANTLEAALRRFRRNEARRRKLKPYQVFQDRALLGLCAKLPASQAELLEVWGMGDARVEKYGAALLEIVRSHRGENQRRAG